MYVHMFPYILILLTGFSIIFMHKIQGKKWQRAAVTYRPYLKCCSILFLANTTLLSNLSSAVVCGKSADGFMYSCCISSGLLNRTLSADFHFDACNYKLTVNMENIKHEINMLKYEWGKFTFEKLNLIMLSGCAFLKIWKM